MMTAIGCDISQKTIDIQILDDKESYIKIPNNECGFNKLLGKLAEKSEQYHVCMEATGNYYEDFADFMAERGFRVTVVNPLKIAYFAKTDFQKAKTDKQDCKLIARYCKEKLLQKQGAYKKPTEVQYKVKRLLTYIQQLKRQKVALKNRWKSNKDEFVTEELKKQISDTQNYIKAAETKLKELTESEDKERLKTIPGISETTAQILLHYLGMFGFKSEKEFVSFAGLSPSHAKSGTSVNKKERLSRYGNRILKNALYMPAVVAYRMGVFREFANRLKLKGKSGKVIVVAIMRKLAALAFTLYERKQSYDLKKMI